MSVDIEPLELNFRRPFTVEVTETLKIKNPGSSPLAFKVKTTAPKQYCVRPNAGRIEPGQDFDVSVIHSAMKEDVAPGTKCRDKFLVQSAPITPDKEFANIASVLESTDKSLVQERKIRVNWLAPASEETSSHVAAATTPNRKSLSNGAADTPDAARSFSSPSANAESAPPPYTSDNNFEDDDKSDRPKSAVSQAATSISNTAQATYEELKTKLAQAEAQLANVNAGGLRQRNVKGSAAGEKASEGQATQAVKQSAEGVAVPVVAFLCLLSFLLAYFFF